MIDANEAVGGLSSGAIAGVVIASAAVVSLILYLLAFKKHPDEEAMNGDDDGDGDLQRTNQIDTAKELMAITNGEVDPDAPVREESPDSSTVGMTFSDSGSLSTKESPSEAVAASNYYANNSLLPVNPDEESLSTNDQPSFFSSDESVEMQGATSSK